MSKTVRLVQNMGSGLLIFFFSVIPLIFLPITQEYYETNKFELLVFTGLLVIILWSIRTIISKDILISFNKSGLAFALLALSGFLSLIFVSPNKVEALVTPFGFTAFIFLTLIFLLGGTFLTARGKLLLRFGLLSSAAVCALLSVYQYFGFGKTLFPNSFLAGTGWTPVGSSIGLATVLIIVIPLALSTLITGIKHKKEVTITLSSICLLLLGIGLILTLVNLLPNLSSTLLPIPAAWAIILESFKNPLNAFLGVGAGNYLTAFTLGRPVFLNAGPLWGVRFVLGPSFLFEITTTLGLLGLLGLVILLKGIIHDVKSKNTDLGLKGSFILAVLAIIFIPPNLTLLVLVAALLFLAENDEKKLINIHLRAKNIWLLALSVTLTLIALVLFYPFGRAYAAELAYFRSLSAKSQNDGTATYNQNIEAINLNPNMTLYHLGLSQTSLALASVIVNGSPQASGSAALSDADKTTVAKLIQQAISEAKIGTTLAPKSVVAWQNLATVYESLEKVAQGADQWTVAAYQQTIALDPANPILRVRLGGVYLTLNRLDEASQQFLLATQLKPDYANAHYNLAYIYRSQKKYLNAAIELTTTESLIQAGSDDEKKVTSELADVKKNLTKAELDYLANQNSANAGSNTPGILSPVDSGNSPLTPGFNLPTEASPSPVKN